MILTGATFGEEASELLRAYFPRCEHVTHRGVLVPTLRQRFHFVRGDKGEIGRAHV